MEFLNNLLSPIGPLMTAFSGFRDAISRIESDRQAADELETTLVQARIVYDEIVKIQLRGINVRALENKFKIFIICFYKIENLMDKLQLKRAEPKNALAEGTSQLFKQITTPGKVEKLHRKLNNTVNRWENIVQRELTTAHPNIGAPEPYLESVTIIGRESETNEIVEMLLSSQVKIGVSIIGIRGLGKTSIARKIFFDDQRIQRHFSHKKWVHIEDGKFVWDNIRGQIEPCIEEVQANQAHRLLIVFDNLLCSIGIEWDKFWSYTKNKEVNKSVIVIITTRNEDISGQTFTAPYHLKVLSEILCEKVIKDNANLYMEDTEPLEPSFLSAIAKKCEGSPWIAQRIGNILGKRDVEQREAMGDMTWLCHSSEFQTEILPHLAFRYIDMDSELRRCLGYLSLFPVQHRFNADDLVRLWVGEGFAESKETGENYVGNLKRSLTIQSEGQEYKLQSFGHHFAVLVALGTCLLLDQVSSLPSLNKNIHHLSFNLSCPFDQDTWSLLKRLRLRTFLSLYTTDDVGMLGKIPPELHESLSHLRVLSLKRTNVTELPIFIQELRHLRYLDVSFTKLKKLRSKIHNLRALQFLKIEGLELSHWPREFHKLANLTYVDWEQSDIRKKGIPRHIGKLSLLESLPLFQIGTEDGYSIKELVGMNKLKGSLWIENLQLVAGEEEAKGAMLHNKHDLRTIQLQWKPQQSKKKGKRPPSKEKEEEEKRKECAHHKSILRGLKPSEKLRELIIKNYKGDDLPEWISDSKIEKLRLNGCSFSDSIPGFVTALGKMKELKILVLENMESIKLLRCHSDGDGDTGVCFPKLESVELHNMPQLESWTEVNACDMPRLRRMKFVNCPQIGSFVESFRRKRHSLIIDNQLIPHTDENENNVPSPNEEHNNKKRKFSHVLEILKNNHTSQDV